MELGVVLLDAGTPYGLKVLSRPVQLKAPGDGVHQALVALKDFQGTGNAAHGEEGGVGSPEGCIGISQPFPVGEASSTSDAQGVVGCPAYGDGVRDPALVKAQRFAHSSRHRVGSLRGVIEALRSHRGNVREAALNLVGERQGRQEFPAALMSIFAGGKHRTEVVAGVTGLLWGDVAVVVVQVAYKRRVVESRAVGRAFSAADERGQGVAAEVFDLGAQHLDRRALKRSNSAAEGIQYANLELLARFLREVFEGHAHDKIRQLFDLCHISLFSPHSGGSSKYARVAKLQGVTRAYLFVNLVQSALQCS